MAVLSHGGRLTGGHIRGVHTGPLAQLQERHVFPVCHQLARDGVNVGAL